MCVVCVCVCFNYFSLFFIIFFHYFFCLGRDVKYFEDAGLRVTGLDGCQEFCDMCKEVCLGASCTTQALVENFFCCYFSVPF